MRIEASIGAAAMRHFGREYRLGRARRAGGERPKIVPRRWPV
jgi:hypothetical protein